MTTGGPWVSLGLARRNTPTRIATERDLVRALDQ
jgi:hypothetical protein